MTVQLSWPPAFSFLTVSIQDLMTADTHTSPGCSARPRGRREPGTGSGSAAR